MIKIYFALQDKMKHKGFSKLEHNVQVKNYNCSIKRHVVKISSQVTNKNCWANNLCLFMSERSANGPLNMAKDIKLKEGRTPYKSNKR